MPGNGNWLENPFNDSKCIMGSASPACQQTNMTTPVAFSLNSSSIPSSLSPSPELSSGRNITTLPPHLMFDERSINDIAAYSVLFVIAAIGNLTVFITLFRNRHRKSRVNLMIMHLAAADLMVTLINFPVEVGWRITVQWLAGNLACKLLNFLRAFGLYLSSLVLVCISLDRYFAIVHPLKVNDAQRRGKMMLSFAWSIAAVCSIPQSVIFYEASHPEYKDFKQCVTFYFFKTPVEERTYNVFCLVIMYFLPLLIIIVVYFRILWEISQKSKDSKEGSKYSGRKGRVRLRRSDMTNIERARARTLKMTVIIVLAFIICWTPYVVMVLWYMFDKQGAEQVQSSFQDALFIMAVSNSCVNPIVYGSYTINLRKELNRCFGRKTQPPVLARKSTGSTALRTTVTAHLNASSTLKMSTHTQILPPRGKLRGSNSIRGNSPSGSISRESPLSHSRRTLYPPSPHTFSSTPSSLQVSCVSSSPKYPSPSHSHPAGSTATGCLMLEIDVEGNRSERDKPSQDDEEGVSAIRETERISVSLEAVSDDLSSTHHTVDNDSHRFPYFPAGTKIQKHGKLPENAMHVAPVPMTSNAKAEAIFAENPKRENGDHEDSVVIIPRKLSTDSGIFFESRQRKKYPNPPALTNPPTSARSRASYDEARETTSTSSTIELKGSNSFSEIV